MIYEQRNILLSTMCVIIPITMTLLLFPVQAFFTAEFPQQHPEESKHLSTLKATVVEQVRSVSFIEQDFY